VEPGKGDPLMVTPMCSLGLHPNVNFRGSTMIAWDWIIKQKTRYVGLHVKEHGSHLHHSIALSSLPQPLNYYPDFGNIFINEKNTKTLTVYSSGDPQLCPCYKEITIQFPHYFSSMWKVNIEVTFAPLNEHKLGHKPHHFTLQSVSGSVYRFQIDRFSL